MSSKLTHKRIFMYAIVAALAFTLVFTVGYPIIQGGYNIYVAPWVNTLLGITPITDDELPADHIFSGNLMVSIPCYDIYDDSAVTPTGIVVKIYHADQTTVFGTKTTPDGSDDIEGQVFASDNNILYMSVDHVATTIYYCMDAESAATTTYVSALAPKDIDNSGDDEHYFKIDLSTLPSPGPEGTPRDLTLPLYFLDADFAYTITSISNPTSADYSGATGIHAYATAYWADGALGDGCKVVRIEMTLPDSANESMVSDGDVNEIWFSWQQQSGSVYKVTGLEGNPFQPGRDRFLVWEASDITEETQGKVLFFDRDVSSTEVGKVTVHALCSGFGASEAWAPTIQFTVLDPAGGRTTETLEVSFTDS